MHEKFPSLIGARDIMTVTYADVVRALATNRDFFHRPDSIRRTIEYGQRVAEALIQIPGVSMVTADGYPYYIAHLTNPQVPVEEIGRFNQKIYQFYDGKIMLGETFRLNQNVVTTTTALRDHEITSIGVDDPYGQEKAQRADHPVISKPAEISGSLSELRRMHLFEIGDATLPCPMCIASRDLINLRDPCAICDWTSFKPRDIMRALHDIDLQAVVMGNPEDYASEIRRIVNSLGIPCNDQFYGRVIINAGKISPVDITVISRRDFESALGRLTKKDNRFTDITVPACKLWLKDEFVNWTVGVNFALSMEPLAAKDDGLIELFQKSKAEFVGIHGTEHIIEILSQFPRVYKRLLQSQDVKNGIRLRLASSDAPFLIPRSPIVY